MPITEGVNEIYVSIDIDEVLRINDKDYSITFATYFNVEWTEHRLFVDPELEVWIWLKNKYSILNYSVFQAQYNKSSPFMSPMNLEFVKDLWLPNIFIYNLKTYKVIDVLSKLAGLWIDTNKFILYSQATHIRWGTGDRYFADINKSKAAVYIWDLSKQDCYTIKVLFFLTQVSFYAVL